MVLVTLLVNGTCMAAEAKNLAEAQQQANEWLKEAKKHFPNKKFTPRFYRVRKIETDGD